MRKYIEVAVLLAATLGVIHCGGGNEASRPTPSSEQGDACTLLTDEEVAAAMGEPVVKKDSGGTADGTTFCHWFAANESPSQSKSVTVMFNGSASWETYGGFKDLAANPRPVDLGDDAFTDDDGPDTVSVLDGSWFLRVGFGTTRCTGLEKSGCEENLTTATALAKKALARLQ